MTVPRTADDLSYTAHCGMLQPDGEQNRRMGEALSWREQNEKFYKRQQNTKRKKRTQGRFICKLRSLSWLPVQVTIFDTQRNYRLFHSNCVRKNRKIRRKKFRRNHWSNTQAQDKRKLDKKQEGKPKKIWANNRRIISGRKFVKSVRERPNKPYDKWLIGQESTHDKKLEGNKPKADVTSRGATNASTTKKAVATCQ